MVRTMHPAAELVQPAEAAPGLWMSEPKPKIHWGRSPSVAGVPDTVSLLPADSRSGPEALPPFATGTDDGFCAVVVPSPAEAVLNSLHSGMKGLAACGGRPSLRVCNRVVCLAAAT